MSDHEVEKSSSVSVTSEEVAWRIRAITDPLTQQLAHLLRIDARIKERASKQTSPKDRLIQSC